MKGKLKRVLSAGIDLLFILIFDFLFYQIIGKWLFDSDLFSTLVGHLCGILILTFVTVSRGGASFGKRLLGLNLSRNKQKLSFFRCLARYLFAYFAYMYTFGTVLFVSVIMLAFRKDNRMLHDLVTGTSVHQASKGGK
ncbi:RDD family protein [Halalkalibacter krulwichiae]|uniref:RDD family protein n=1 Tax=Halalkalibacter krulwichiae TaxID=199441 RepID=A0A1X9MHK1_9BACI|nr:RDD family protein [Halalkalibacter krulwichiae]ARK31990.1 RDD family protein [Halalkalibacter krulwichiae]